MWPLTRESALERQLRQQYVMMLEGFGFPTSMAKRTTRELLATAKKQARSEPNLPPDCGQRLIDREGVDDAIKQMLARKRAEGVTDDDIRWWWGLNRLERRLLIVFDDWLRMTAFLKYRAEGMSEEQAMSEVRKAFPIFGDPKETSDVNGDDRPLPFELKDRINQWACLNTACEIQSRVARTSCMNAFLRGEIRAGRL